MGSDPHPGSLCRRGKRVVRRKGGNGAFPAPVLRLLGGPARQCGTQASPGTRHLSELHRCPVGPQNQPAQSLWEHTRHQCEARVPLTAKPRASHRPALTIRATGLRPRAPSAPSRSRPHPGHVPGSPDLQVPTGPIHLLAVGRKEQGRGRPGGRGAAGGGAPEAQQTAGLERGRAGGSRVRPLLQPVPPRRPVTAGLLCDLRALRAAMTLPEPQPKAIGTQNRTGHWRREAVCLRMTENVFFRKVSEGVFCWTE